MGEDEKQHVSRAELKLELAALKSDLRLLVLASVALNQFLSAVALPQELTAAALLAFVGKGILAAVGSRGA